MKKFLLSTVALVAFAAPAAAADLAARPYTKALPPAAATVMSWTGFYIGVQGGGGWARATGKPISMPRIPRPSSGTQSCTTPAAALPAGLGYNWQSGAFVFGIEGDDHWADINGRSAVINVGPCRHTITRSFAASATSRAVWVMRPVPRCSSSAAARRSATSSTVTMPL